MTQCVTITLPDLKAWRPRQDTFLAETMPTELDGLIVTRLIQLNAINEETGQPAEVPVPPYLPLDCLRGYLQTLAGAEHRTEEGAEIN
jgi:hypothetical protein